MLSLLFATGFSFSSGYKEFKLDSLNPVEVVIPSGYEAFVLLEHGYNTFTLKTTSETGMTYSETIYTSLWLRSLRVQGSKFTMTQISSFTARIGVWLIMKGWCQSAIGISGDYVNYTTRFTSYSDSPTTLCVFPMADNSYYDAQVYFGTKSGTANLYTEKFITGKVSTYQTSINKVSTYSVKDDQWFVQFKNFGTTYPLVINYTYQYSQTYFYGCNLDYMLIHGQNAVNKKYSNVSYFSDCFKYIDPSGLSTMVTWIIVGVVLGVIIIIVVFVLICWPCLVACCAGAAAGAAAANSSINQPLQPTPQYQYPPPQYQPQYPPQYPPQQYPQNGYGYDVK